MDTIGVYDLTTHQRQVYRILHSILLNLTDDDISWMCVEIALFLEASYPLVEIQFFEALPFMLRQ